MVSLTKLYNIKESVFEDLRDRGNPSSGNKGKDREKDFYFVDEPANSETGRVSSKVVYKSSLSNMVKDIEAEAIDMKKLSDENPDDMVIYKIAEELKELFNIFRTHVRKNYPDEYKKISEEEIDEQNTTGTGASFSPGNSPAFATPKAFGDDKKKKLKTYKSIGYKKV
tara:strand:+ start:164 stop:667 length:504 start_codon:yes stop_codon:yes gene_type:complete